VVNFREAGKRKRKFFETKEQAESFAAQKNIDRLNSGLDGEKITSKLRDMALECAERLSEHGKTLKDAADFLIAHLQATKKSCTAEQLVRELLVAKEADGVSRRHLNDICSRLSVFAEKFDGQMVATITSAQLDDWLRSLNVSPVTRNHYRQLLLLAFNFAVRRNYATDNPAEKTAKAKERKSDISFHRSGYHACICRAGCEWPQTFSPWISFRFGGTRFIAQLIVALSCAKARNLAEMSPMLTSQKVIDAINEQIEYKFGVGVAVLRNRLAFCGRGDANRSVRVRLPAVAQQRRAIKAWQPLAQRPHLLGRR
jgi:hypothetical protein